MDFLIKKIKKKKSRIPRWSFFLQGGKAGQSKANLQQQLFSLAADETTYSRWLITSGDITMLIMWGVGGEFPANASPYLSTYFHSIITMRRLEEMEFHTAK